MADRFVRPVARRLAAALCAAAAAVALVAVPASAGTYTVYSCRTPDGALAPIDGWASSGDGQQGSLPTAECGGSGLRAALAGDHAQPVGARLSWTFTPPADTSLRTFWVWRSASTTGGSNEINATPGTLLGWPGSGTEDARENCFQAFGCSSAGTHSSWADASNFYKAPDHLTDATHVVFSALCGGSAGWSCVSRGSGAAPMADERVHAFRALLEESTSPDLKYVAGSLLAAGPVSGTRSVAVRATDTGSGVYRMLIEVKLAGQDQFTVAKTSVIDDNDGACAPVDFDASTDYEFVHAVPCKLSASGQLDFDTASLPDGDHELRVIVEDAAGNRSLAYGPATLAVKNAPSPSTKPSVTPSGTAESGDTLKCDPGSWSPTPDRFEYDWLVSGEPVPGATKATFVVRDGDAGKPIACRVTAYRGQASATATSAATGDPSGSTNASPAGLDPTLAPNPTPAPIAAPNGTQAPGGVVLTVGLSSRRALGFHKRRWATLALTDGAGNPLPGARVNVQRRNAAVGARFRPVGWITTNATGHARYRVPGGPSRALRFEYSSGGDLLATRTVKIRTRSRTTLRTDRRHLLNGQTVAFIGRVVTRPIPKAGVPIEVQALVGRHWTTFRTLRTDRRGRWRTSYRFRFTTGRQTYTFRARVRRDSAFPYTESISRRVSVVVRGK